MENRLWRYFSFFFCASRVNKSWSESRGAEHKPGTNENVGSAVKQHALNELAPDYLQRLFTQGSCDRNGRVLLPLFLATTSSFMHECRYMNNTLQQFMH